MRYDLHVHTKYSICSNLKPEVILAVAKSKGLNGIAITDHNSIAGALEVKNLNKEKDFEVIVGEEIQADTGHVLAYYLRKKILAGTLQEVLERARRQGAIVALAHPMDVFRKHFSMEAMLKHIKQLDAVETFNARTINPIFSDSSYQLAKKYGLASIAGSDAHFSYEIGGAVTIFNDSLRAALRLKKTTTEGSMILGAFGVAHTFLHKNFSRF
jgi:predicted metal-dependent phosphoesterase TrpH